MAIRGKYSAAEKKIIEGFDKKLDSLIGWAKFPNQAAAVATETAMKSNALTVDYWNPLWRNDDYAASTRWGTIVAIPTFQDHYGFGQLGDIEAPPEMGFQHMIYIGEDWEFFKPIRPGDSFRVWFRRGEMVDTTPLDGKSPRTFAIKEYEREHINQKDELVSTSNIYVQRSFLSGPPKPYSMPKFGYTKEIMDYVVRTMGEEEIRGRNIRYWEDVKVGEETNPVVLGPTTEATTANPTGSGVMGFGRDPRASMQKDPMGALLQDPKTKLWYAHAGRHMSDRAALAEGEPCAFLFGVSSKFNLIRCITNWMGDDGFVRKLNWRHIMRIAIGDTVIGRGKVTGKRIENGEYLVDLLTWGQNLRGNVTETAAATVSLLSKKASLKWK